MSRKQIGIRARRVSQLLKNVSEDRFAIPKLQREFVWDGPKAAKLFDSLLAHMPITNVKAGFKQVIRERNDCICRELEAEAGIRLFRKDI